MVALTLAQDAVAWDKVLQLLVIFYILINSGILASSLYFMRIGYKDASETIELSLQQSQVGAERDLALQTVRQLWNHFVRLYCVVVMGTLTAVALLAFFVGTFADGKGDILKESFCQSHRENANFLTGLVMLTIPVVVLCFGSIDVFRMIVSRVSDAAV